MATLMLRVAAFWGLTIVSASLLAIPYLTLE